MSWSVAARISADAIGLVIVVLALASSAAFLSVPIKAYDEGILLTNANAVLHGRLPHRDFYSNYPPGIFWTLAAVWKVFGVSVVWERLFGFCLHVGVAALAARLVARAVGRRFSWLAMGVVLEWLVDLHLTAFAWLGGLACALATIELFLVAEGAAKRWRWIACGLAWGALSCFRHDLFVYATSSLVIGCAVWCAVRRHNPWRSSRREMAMFALGVAIPMCLVWLPTFATAGIQRVTDDLYFEQVRHVYAARVLPLPELRVLVNDARIPFRIPVFLEKPFEGAVVWDVIAPGLGVLLTLLGRWVSLRDARVTLALTCLAAAVLPQAMGRTDTAHTQFAVAIGLALGVVLLECLLIALWRPFKFIALAAMAFLVAYPAHDYLSAFSDLRLPQVPHGPPPLNGIADDKWGRADLVRFIQDNTAPEEQIFVATRQHRRIFINEVELYYIADRTGAARYTQFDPNMMNRDDVQREVIADLGRKATRMVVVSDCCLGWEPNESMREGSSLLDEYLRAHFREAARVGPYVVLMRQVGG